MVHRKDTPCNLIGTIAVPNTTTGIIIGDGAQFNIIGAASPDNGNVISGNSGEGILLSGSANNAIAGNYIGATADGSGNLGNGLSGITLIKVLPPGRRCP